MTAAALRVVVGADTKDAEAGLKRVGGLVSGFGKTAAVAGSALVAGLAVGFGASINAAASFEQVLSGVQAVSGATASEMAQLRTQALALGQDVTLSGISAQDAARAMEELAKGGLSVEDQLAGGTRAALLLASAGGLDVARAAEITATSLSQFSLSGRDAAQVADLFSAAANSSAIEVNDVAMAMAQGGQVAAQLGFTIQDTTAAIAAFGAAGLKGSDAGTSMKTALLNLVNPTDKAKAVMDQYGLSFFDTNGKMLDFQGIAGQLRTGLKDLSDQQRLAALETIFGSDAVRAAAILYNNGAEGIAAWNEQVGKAGSAAAVGATRNDNLRGSIQQLQSSWETAQIALGTAFLPVLRQLVDGMTAAVNAAIPFIQVYGTQLAGAVQAGLGRAVATVQAFIPAIQSLFAAFQTGDFNQAFGPFLAAIELAFGAESAAKVALWVSDLLRGLQLVRDMILTVQQAWASNWLPSEQIQPAVNAVGQLVLGLNGMATALQTFLGPALTQFMGELTAFATGAPAELAQVAAGFDAAQLSALTFRQNTVQAIDEVLVALGLVAPAAATMDDTLSAHMANAGSSTTTFRDTAGFSLKDVENALNSLNMAVTNNGVMIHDAFVAMGQSLDEFDADVRGAVGSANAQITGMLPVWLTSWTALGQAVDTFDAGLRARVASIGGAISDLNARISGMLPVWLTSWQAMGDAVQAATSRIVGIVGALPGQILGVIAGLGGALYAAGAAAMGQLAAGFLSRAQAAVDAVRSVIGQISDMLPHSEPKDPTSPLRGLADSGRALVEMFAAGIGDAAPEAVKQAAEVASAVAGALKSGLEALTALGNFKAPKAGAVSAFGASFTDFFEKFATWAGGWEEDVLKQSGLFADAASKAAGLLKSGAEALTSLRDFVAPPEAAVSAFGRAIADYLEKLTTIAGGFEADGLAAAVAFSEAAGKALSILKTGVDGLTALIDFKRPTDAAIGAFKFATEFLVRSLGDSAAVMDADFAASAGKWAESAGKGLALLGNGVKGLSELADFRRPTDAAIGAFKFAVEFLVQSVADSAAVMDKDFVAAAAAWSDRAGKALAIIGNGVDGLAKLADFKAPSARAIDEFAAAVAYLVRRFGEVAIQMGTEGVAQAGAFGTAANSALTAAKTGIDAFVALGKLVVPSQQAIDQLLAGVQYTVQRMGQIAAEIGTAGLAQAVAFATAAGTVFTTLKTAIELLGSLGKLKQGPMDAIDQLLSGVKGAVAKAGDLIAEAQDLERQAIRFRDTMASARAIFAEGMGGGGGMAPALAGGVAVPTAPPATGGGHTSTTIVNVNAPTYGVNQVEDVVVSAVVSAQRRGRL